MGFFVVLCGRDGKDEEEDGDGDEDGERRGSLITWEKRVVPVLSV